MIWSEDKFIEIYGARENNLKNIDLRIPRNELVVVTGLSGSGKSSFVTATLVRFRYAPNHLSLPLIKSHATNAYLLWD